MSRSVQKATKAQRQCLSGVSYGHLTRSGRFTTFYHMHNSPTPTAPMVERLEALQWIDWQENKAFLTEAGQAAHRGELA